MGETLREPLPLRGLEEVRVLDALYGTHNLFRLQHAPLAVALDHFAALGLRLGLQEAPQGAVAPASLYEVYQQYDRPRGAPPPSLTVLEDASGGVRVARDEEELKAHAFFGLGAPAEVMGERGRSATRLRAIAQQPGVRFYSQETPFEQDSPMVEIPVERAWSELQAQRYVFVGTEKTQRPECIASHNLQEGGRPSVLGLLESLGASRDEAMRGFVRAEGCLPGLDEVQSAKVLRDLHARVLADVASPDGNPLYVDQDLFMAGSSYQVLVGALEKTPAWRGAVPALQRYVVGLGPGQAQGSLDNVKWAVHEREDADTLSAFFDLAATLGRHDAAREAFPFVQEQPWRPHVAAEALWRFERAGVPPARAVAVAPGHGQDAGEAGQRGDDARCETDRLLALYDQFPHADPRSVQALYERVEDQLRDGAWKNRSREEVLQALMTQALHSQDPDVVYRRLESSLRQVESADGTASAPGIERRGEDVYIGGVRIPTRGNR